MSTKKEQRALKGPDLFQARSRKFLNKLKENPQTLLIVFGIVILSIGGFFLSKYYSNQKLEKRSSEIWAADKLFEAELTSFQENIYSSYTKMNELDSSLRKLKEDKQAKDKNKAEIEKLEKEMASLEEKAKSEKPNHTESTKAYQAFHDKHQGTAEGTRAGIQVIHQLAQEKKFEEAENFSLQVLKSMNPSSLFYSSLLKLRIKLLSENSKIEEALSETEKLLANSQDSEQAEALLLKGNLLLQAKKEQEAEKIFDTVITHFHATSELKSQARAFKALIF